MLRFASSPTENININTLRVAILNYLVAQQEKENFLIRMDDLDKARNIEGKDTEIMQILEKFALKHESVFHQSEHLHMYQTLAIKLLEMGKAFVCTCEDEESTLYSGHCDNNIDKAQHAKLKESGTPFVIRMKKPAASIVIQDLVLGESITTPDEVDAFVILHTDGTPSELFASACDDILSGISTIIEDAAHLRGDARALHSKIQLGYTAETRYAHLPAMHNTPTIKALFEEGYLPDAIINYLLLLSNPHAPQKIFTLPEAIEWFKLEEVPHSAVAFDIPKLRDINRTHLMNMDDKLISKLFGFADADIGKLAKLYLKDVCTITELKAKIEPIFAPKDFEGEWATQMRTMETLIQDAPMFHEFSAFETYLLEKSGLSGKAFFGPLRLLLTGAQHGPELSDIYPLIKPYILEIAS